MSCNERITTPGSHPPSYHRQWNRGILNFTGRERRSAVRPTTGSLSVPHQAICESALLQTRSFISLVQSMTFTQVPYPNQEDGGQTRKRLMEIALYRTSHATPELQRVDGRKVDSYIFCHYRDAIDTYAGTQDTFGREPPTCCLPVV